MDRNDLIKKEWGGMRMRAKQLTIPADNEPGKLAIVTDILSHEKINIRAITISSFGDRGFFNIIVDDPEAAFQVLTTAAITAQLKQVLAVLMNDKPGGVDAIIQLLAKNNINIENAYGFVVESHKKAVFVIECNEIDEAEKLLDENKIKTLDAESLNAIEPFHYMKY